MKFEKRIQFLNKLFHEINVIKFLEISVIFPKHVEYSYAINESEFHYGGNWDLISIIRITTIYSYSLKEADV